MKTPNRLFLAVAIALVLTVTSYGAKCTGSSNCKACTTCSSCKYCSKDGGTCSVCANRATDTKDAKTGAKDASCCNDQAKKDDACCAAPTNKDDGCCSEQQKSPAKDADKKT